MEAGYPLIKKSTQKSASSKAMLISAYSNLMNILIYDLVSVVTCLNIYLGLVLFHFQKQ